MGRPASWPSVHSEATHECGSIDERDHAVPDVAAIPGGKRLAGSHDAPRLIFGPQLLLSVPGRKSSPFTDVALPPSSSSSWLPKRKSIDGVPEAGRRKVRSEDQSEMRARINTRSCSAKRSSGAASRHAGDLGWEAHREVP